MKAAHGVGWLNIDVKPDNMLLGAAPDSTDVYMVDWGCGLKYLNAAGTFLDGGNHGGNDLYRSLFAHDNQCTCLGKEHVHAHLPYHLPGT